MRLPPADLSYVLDRFNELADQIDAVSEDNETDPDAPAQLCAAMAQLLELLARVGDGQPAPLLQPGELTTYGDYGMHMLEQLADAALRAEREDLRQAVEQLSLPFALWILRNGGELRQLRAVVNALAQLADETRQANSLVDIYACCCEVIEAADAAYERRGPTNPAEPWRRLLLNRAVIATRCQNPDLMETAYDAIVEHLPGDAERFFSDGMEQAVLNDYPDQARELVRRYFLAHSKPRHLH